MTDVVADGATLAFTLQVPGAEARFTATRGPADGEAYLVGQITAIQTPWYREFVRTDPAAAWRRVRAPVLALFGELDLQVPATQNLEAVREALEAGGHGSHELQILPGLNHLFQTAGTGLIDEYATLTETFAPRALDRLTAWVVARVAAPHGE